jgi:hypothetical protein
MFCIEHFGRLDRPAVIAGLATVFTALGPAILAIAKRQRAHARTDVSTEILASDAPTATEIVTTVEEATLTEKGKAQETTIVRDVIVREEMTGWATHAEIQRQSKPTKEGGQEQKPPTSENSDASTPGQSFWRKLPKDAFPAEPKPAAADNQGKIKPSEFTAMFRPGQNTEQKRESSTTLKVTRTAPAPYARTTPRIEAANTYSTTNHGSIMLVCYAVVLVLFGAFAVIHYWDSIKLREDLAFSIGGLFLMMVAGMFVQVITSNYRVSAPLFHVTASQLTYPLLFSPIVFYPVWALTSGGAQHAFALYAAFLDGYFWESVVSSAKTVNIDAPNSNTTPRTRKRKPPVTPQPSS